MENVNSVLVETILSVAGAALTWFLIWVRKTIQEKVEQEYLQQLLLRFADAIDTAVREAAQTVTPKLKEAAADGKISEDERTELKNNVRLAALDQLTAVDREKLAKLFGVEQLDRKIDRQIEAVVQRLKEKNV
jgi:hypothetical protein